MDVRQKAVAKGVTRSQIKRFQREDYVRMYSGGALTNVVNCRIGSKLHQVRLIIFILICTIIYDCTYDYLFSGVNNGARKAWTLPL